ncbi:hypothetical protein DSO57_1020584 [Entomophthora muscae]|uniref:Uncharacterized protein n=1 Tax=Entomophthora muscae TaxID=34485 RepID=A0ACC2TEN4_9FUNG|nr:hypothetical protein DSO57_1020584 [Entomophthora muscae]
MMAGTGMFVACSLFRKRQTLPADLGTVPMIFPGVVVGARAQVKGFEGRKAETADDFDTMILYGFVGSKETFPTLKLTLTPTLAADSN